MPILVMAGLPKTAVVTTNPPSFDDMREEMHKDNYAQDTIDRYTRILKTLQQKGANLTNPESVKHTIAQQDQWCEGTKAGAVNAIKLLYQYLHIQSNFPEYKHESKIPFIPLESELDQLIAGARHQLATFLQCLKETASRYGEIYRLKWTDYDTEQGTLTISQPEKHSNPHQVKISNKLQGMLNQLPHTKPKIFQYENKDSLRKTFQKSRKKLAKKLGNPRLLQIHFHTFRHWKATTEFHKTNNIIVVMKLLGHKCLNNTQRYIQLLPDLTDDYVCEIATDVKQAAKLVENGYEYVTGEYNDGGKLFRKRK